MSHVRDPQIVTTASRPLARNILAVVIVLLLGTGGWFRVMHLSSVPGISGDEGWWGVQALAWKAGQPYEAYTTSGNPTDQFFLVPLAILHGIARPSFLLLRAFPAAVNLLALPVGFLLARRLFGTTTASAYAVGIAVLPTAIAHSRICQDPSQTVFWTSLVIFLSLLGVKERDRAWVYVASLLVVFPIALWTHPTNIFIGPFLLLPCAAALRPLLPPSRNGRLMLAAATALMVAAMLLGAWFALTKLAGSNQLLDRPWLSIAAARLVDARQWFELAANGARLFNGVTIYHYFSGARPPTVPFDVIFVAVAGTLLCGFALPRVATRLDYALLLACAGTWLAFYSIAGPQSLRPHAERWGLCLIVPSMLVLARGLTAWIVWRPNWRAVPIALSCLVAAALLSSFHVNYFTTFATTGGRGHLTYATAAIEPKRQVLELILERSAGDPVAIATDQWWLYWPIRYLATDHREVSVTMTGTSDPDSAGVPIGGRVFFVEFAGTPELGARVDWIRAHGRRATSTIIGDAGGRDLLEVIEIAPD